MRSTTLLLTCTAFLWFFPVSIQSLRSLLIHSIDGEALSSDRLEIHEDESFSISVSFNETTTDSATSRNFTISAICSDEPHRTAEIFIHQIANESICNRNYSILVGDGGENFKAKIEGKFVGWASLMVHGENSSAEVRIAVLRKLTDLDWVFEYVIIPLALLLNCGLGLELDFKDVLAVLKNPKAPLIGMLCQFLILPACTTGLLLLVNVEPNEMALGIFAIACSAGGSQSNFHSYLSGGNLPLSITMTALSTLGAFVSMPIWMYTVGMHVILHNTQRIQIPFTIMIGTGLGNILPFVIGGAIRYKWPKVAGFIFRWFIRPLMIIIIMYFCTLGIYTNLYIFNFFTWKVVFLGLLIPYSAMLLSGFLAFVLKLEYRDIITVAIETAMQNGSVAMFMMKASQAHPDYDILIAGCVALFIFTPVPVYCYELSRLIYLKCIHRKEDEAAKNEGAEIETASAVEGHCDPLVCTESTEA